MLSWHDVKQTVLTCPWKEVVPVLVEGYGHDSVCQVEGLLYPVAVVNIYVYVQYPRVVSMETGTREEEVLYHLKANYIYRDPVTG